MEKTSTKAYRFWYRRRGAATIGLISLLLAYVTASRAIETGSLQQYGATIALLILAINRIAHAFRNR